MKYDDYSKNYFEIKSSIGWTIFFILLVIPRIDSNLVALLNIEKETLNTVLKFGVGFLYLIIIPVFLGRFLSHYLNENYIRDNFKKDCRVRKILLLIWSIISILVIVRECLSNPRQEGVLILFSFILICSLYARKITNEVSH
jgi:hypothetical protein